MSRRITCRDRRMEEIARAFGSAPPPREYDEEDNPILTDPVSWEPGMSYGGQFAVIVVMVAIVFLVGVLVGRIT